MNQYGANLNYSGKKAEISTQVSEKQTIWDQKTT